MQKELMNKVGILVFASCWTAPVLASEGIRATKECSECYGEKDLWLASQQDVAAQKIAQKKAADALIAENNVQSSDYPLQFITEMQVQRLNQGGATHTNIWGTLFYLRWEDREAYGFKELWRAHGSLPEEEYALPSECYGESDLSPDSQLQVAAQKDLLKVVAESAIKNFNLVAPDYPLLARTKMQVRRMHLNGTHTDIVGTLFCLKWHDRETYGFTEGDMSNKQNLCITQCTVCNGFVSFSAAAPN